MNLLKEYESVINEIIQIVTQLHELSSEVEKDELLFILKVYCNNSVIVGYNEDGTPKFVHFLQTNDIFGEYDQNARSDTIKLSNESVRRTIIDTFKNFLNPSYQKIQQLKTQLKCLEYKRDLVKQKLKFEMEGEYEKEKKS